MSAAETRTAAYTSDCPACGRRIVAGRSTIARGVSGRWVHADCADTPIRPPVELAPADRRRLRDAAERAYAEGWQRHEADEPIRAVARRLGIDVDPPAVAVLIREFWGDS